MNETLELMKEAELTKKCVLGVKGISPLVKIPNFDLISCTPVDFMHSVCLGVTKYLNEIWFDSKNNRMEFYLGLKTKQIDAHLLEINPYTEISRYPRNISDRNQWKANEWLNWLLYFSNPCLIHFLPEIHFKHYQLLRKSIRILLGKNYNNVNLIVMHCHLVI